MRQAYTYWMALALRGRPARRCVFLLLRSRTGRRAAGDPRRRGGSRVARACASTPPSSCVFVLAGFGCGAAGALTLANTLFIQPQSIFGVQWSAYMIFMVLVGGLGTFEGPIIGALLFFVVQYQFADAGRVVPDRARRCSPSGSRCSCPGACGACSPTGSICGSCPVGYHLRRSQTRTATEDPRALGTVAPALHRRRVVPRGSAAATYPDHNPWTGERPRAPSPPATPTTPAGPSPPPTPPSAGWARRCAGRPPAASSCAPPTPSTGAATEIVGLLAAETGCGAPLRRPSRSTSACRCCARRPGSPTPRPARCCPSDVRRHPRARDAPARSAWSPPSRRGTRRSCSPGAAIVGPMALGNTVVLKPSEESPHHRRQPLGRAVRRGGPAAGRPQRGHPRARRRRRRSPRSSIANPHVRRINFTGSTVTGRRLAESAGRHLKRVGAAAQRPEPAARARPTPTSATPSTPPPTARSSTRARCACAPAASSSSGPIADEFTDRFADKVAALPVGDPRDPATVIGPLINQWALSLVTRRVEEAVELGARVLTGGDPEPPCYPATVLTDVPAGGRDRVRRDVRARSSSWKSSTTPTTPSAGPTPPASG